MPREKLISTRESQGYTQYTFAKAVGTSRSHYSQIETGDKTPSLKLAIRIKAVLGYPFDDIFFDTKCPESRHG